SGSAAERASPTPPLRGTSPPSQGWGRGTAAAPKAPTCTAVEPLFRPTAKVADERRTIGETQPARQSPPLRGRCPAGPREAPYSAPVDVLGQPAEAEALPHHPAQPHELVVIPRRIPQNLHAPLLVPDKIPRRDPGNILSPAHRRRRSHPGHPAPDLAAANP